MRVFSCGAFRWIHERNDCDANALAADVDVSSFIAQKQKQKKKNDSDFIHSSERESITKLNDCWSIYLCRWWSSI